VILVAGGTGRLGHEVVRRLTDRGEPVRVLTRDPGRGGLPPGTEVATGDVRDPRTLTAALREVRTVVSAIHGFLGPRGVSPGTVDEAGNRSLVVAARAVGSDVVLVSVVGAAPDSPFELFRAKYAAEQHLRASGVEWTVVRSSAFLETWLDVLRGTAARSGRPVVFGRGDNPVNFVPVNDVAAAVVAAVLDRSTRGQVLEVEGAEDLTLVQLAERVTAETGFDGPPRHVPRAVLHLMAGTVGLVRPELARQAHAALAMDTTPLRGGSC
jgi:NADH dehydrogenase